MFNNKHTSTVEPLMCAYISSKLDTPGPRVDNNTLVRTQRNDGETRQVDNDIHAGLLNKHDDRLSIQVCSYMVTWLVVGHTFCFLTPLVCLF